MAKKKNEEMDYDALFTDIATDVGGEILDKLDQVKNWVDSGSLALNYICSGQFCGEKAGIPSGKICEIYGESSTCKTLFATNILRGVQKNGIAVFIDAENSLSKEFAQKASGLDPKRVVVIKVDSLEKGFAKIHTVIRKIREKIPNTKPIVIVYDSIASSPSDREFAETTVDEGASMAERKAAGAGSEKPGERARVCSSELRKLTPILDKNNATVIFINQVRTNIMQMFGDPDTTAGGGRALKFYGTLRLKTTASKRLYDDKENVVGIRVSVFNTKNKCFKPFVTAKDMFLFFDQGINPFSGLLTLMEQIGRIKCMSAGNYEILEPYAPAGTKFKSSKERNDIPAEVLLKNYKLVDATDASQVQYYIDLFDKALIATDSNNKEQDVSEDQELDG